MWQIVEMCYLHTYLVVLIASFVSMMRLMRIMSYKSRFLRWYCQALLVVPSPVCRGMPLGRLEEELVRQICAHVPGGVDIPQVREWSAESGQMCVL